ncbi:MAG: hypothetical protein HZB50_04210 [Chloroflexi bacterium]|nr:hypothetical protein [Chloroflexota bacterium]
MSFLGKTFYALSIIAIAILIGLLILVRNIPSDAVIAFLGVLFGGALSGFIQYSISEANRKQNLRLAALDKRLQVAQEAHTQWLRLRRLPHPDEEDDGTPVEETLRKSRDWWESNSLFLTAEARIAFRKALLAAMDLAELRSRRAEWKDLKSRYEEIEQAGKVIEESVFLPSVGALEGNRPPKRAD